MKNSIKPGCLLILLAFAGIASSCGRLGYEIIELENGTDTGADTDVDTDNKVDTDTGSETSTDTEVDTTQATDSFVENPLGDSSSFSFVFPYRGRIWLGPRTDGRGAVSLSPGESTTENASFSFFRDQTGGNEHNNGATAPYPSIGRAGCQAGTPACGPDNEDGRGLFTAGTIQGTEWLVVAGARSGQDLDYVYMTRDTDDVLNFSYVDLSAVMGPQTEGISAMHVLGDRVYLGAPDIGGKRPYLVMFQTLPSGDGLDATGNKVDKNNDDPCQPATHDACTLRADAIAGIGLSTEAAMVDSITSLGSRIYIANNGGVARARIAEPLDAFNYPEHWTVITPSSSDYTSLASITTTKTANIEPADKAVPAMVVFQGRLFLARNTEAGPQLWVCNPGLVSGPAPATAADCDPGDWDLVAPNGSLDGRLTQFDNSDNGRISLLEATPYHLYIGFDNPADGVVVFRTASPNPSLADFRGDGGCSALDHPTACEGIGGNGLNHADNSRIFSSTVVSTGQNDYLYLVAGNGTDPARVIFWRE